MCSVHCSVKEKSPLSFIHQDRGSQGCPAILDEVKVKQVLSNVHVKLSLEDLPKLYPRQHLFLPT